MSSRGVTVGPPLGFCAAPLPTKRMPVEPDSVDPMASVITRFGNNSRKRSLIVGLKIAAEEDNAMSAEVS